MSFPGLLSLLELAVKILPTAASIIVAVLHASGADKHKTVAGQVADGLTKAGEAAAALHGFLQNGVAPPEMVNNPPT